VTRISRVRAEFAKLKRKRPKNGAYGVRKQPDPGIRYPGGLQAIKDELIEQIKQCEALFVLPGLYEQKRDLVRFMMDVADANHKKMIAIRAFGGVAETPQEVLDRTQELIEWNDREMADALRRQARGEDTARWEVLDFPGFDADGPTE
jgi:hypothetical protein